MALARHAPGARLVAALAAVCVWIGAASAQESGARDTSSRSIWSRVTGARQYEYDERLDLSLDGSATVDVNASLASLVALHGARLDTDPEARLDRAAIRALFDAPGATIRDISGYRRHGRRFVHVRFDIDAIGHLHGVAPLAWSSYRLERTGQEYRFVQDVGAPAPPAVPAPPALRTGWKGDELVAFRIHLPSKINFHNSPDDIERGNILVWEQRLRDRLAGARLHMEARMETQSILYRTLWLFGGTFAAALAALALVVWWVARRGRRRTMVPA